MLEDKRLFSAQSLSLKTVAVPPESHRSSFTVGPAVNEALRKLLSATAQLPATSFIKVGTHDSQVPRPEL